MTHGEEEEEEHGAYLLKDNNERNNSSSDESCLTNTNTNITITTTTTTTNEIFFIKKSIKAKCIDWILIIILLIIQGVTYKWHSSHIQCIPGDSGEKGHPNCHDLNKTANFSYPKKGGISTLNNYLLAIGVWCVFLIVSIGCSCAFNKYSLCSKNFILMIEAVFREIVAAVIGTEVFGNGIKYTVGRPRPNYWNNEEKEKRESFPSMHVSVSFAFCGLLSYHLLFAGLYVYQKRQKEKESLAKYWNTENIHTLFLGPLFDKMYPTVMPPTFIILTPLIVSTIVGITRIIQYWHHYSDVIAGALIALIWTALVFAFFSFELFPPPPRSSIPHSSKVLRTKSKNTRLETIEDS